jgi:hypothetical protein
MRIGILIPPKALSSATAPPKGYSPHRSPPGFPTGEWRPPAAGLGAVDLVAQDPAAALQALPIAGLAAIVAGAATADAGDQHAVAGAQAAHAVAGLLDGTDRLVAQDPALVHRGHVALEDVQVGPADGGRVDPDDDVAVVEDLGVRYFFPGLLSGTVVDEGSHGFLR